MSSWVYLCEGDADGETLTMTERHTEGGTYAVGGVGGSNECCMSVTWNYTPHFMQVFDGASLQEALHGKRAGDVLPWLEKAVRQLGDNPSGDYWAKTPGNAGHCLAVLMSWAAAHPDGVFCVH